ncbi:Rapamycin-insensitive companion of mTOR, N-term-domain-containing protein [Fimicolochytrium jonesii]|uniref:Rapamycin-insensitive companion of mTOR, N-term-domain-containing protein n=1 Tax=Fimicolochytrium jonesii TaxID=1396493 RepID=UPI0022FE8972|nr:Rapamycin-insensitive companion of mTOR, N-term-domain-containing protein [Fimicolochytrium jonesii]KAI8823473.1 Rapamycin-insensitive companion of mTOR, N-term-domain-containing protein [Fimicolochytrium jonesii]
MRTLTRDQRYEVEKEQALKLVRSFLDMNGGADILPQSLVRSLVSLAESADDKFRGVCLETLCELAIRNMPLLTLAGGTSVVFGALLEVTPELLEVVVKTVLYMLDSQKTRTYMRPSVELEMIISQFTDAYSRGSANEGKLLACAKAVTLLFKSWTGIIYLCLDDKRAIRSIVESLRLPYDENRKILLEMLFDIFHIEVPNWYPDFISARTHLARRGSILTTGEISEAEAAILQRRSVKGKNLVDHYLSMVLIIFVDVGLVEVLIELLQHENKYITTRVTILIAELLNLCSCLLPSTYGTKLQSLSTLFRVAADFQDENKRHQGTVALTYIDSLRRSKGKGEPQGPRNESVLDRVSTNGAQAAIQRQVESVKARMGMQMDEAHFKILIADLEKVLSLKEHTKWNWETILELIQGPLRNPKRFDEAVKNSKVVKRLMSFYRPLNRQFSDIRRSKANNKYLRVGCELLKTLLSHADGVRFLTESKFLPEIADCLGQLDPGQSTPQADVIFSQERMEDTMTGEYFTLLGVCMLSVEGIRIFEKFRMFSLFYRLTELRSRYDLVMALIRSMDYTTENHARVLLSKLMTSGNRSVRLAATNHLRTILEMDIPDFSGWGIQLLVTQLYDPSIEVCETAVELLDIACNDPQNLESAVNLRPSLDHLGEAGNPLLLRFLSSSVGFTYLQELGFIESEVDYWFEEGNIQYAVRLELSVHRAFFPNRKSGGAKAPPLPTQNDRDAKSNVEVDGTAPPHFYGELASTPEGSLLLRRKGHFAKFADSIRKALVHADFAELLQLKGVLWAVGNIGSVKTGLPFLLEFDVIRQIVELARTSPVITLRGTCYYVLGLIAKTAHGVEVLEDFGWETVLRPNGTFEGLCVPKSPSALLAVPTWDFKGAWPEYTVDPQHAFDALDADEQGILTCIGNMSNHILANAASKALSKLRTDSPNVFLSTSLYTRHVIPMLSIYHFRLSARRFIHDLFDRVTFTDAETAAKLDEIPRISFVEMPLPRRSRSRKRTRRKMALLEDGLWEEEIEEESDSDDDHRRHSGNEDDSDEDIREQSSTLDLDADGAGFPLRNKRSSAIARRQTHHAQSNARPNRASLNVRRAVTVKQANPANYATTNRKQTNKIKARDPKPASSPSGKNMGKEVKKPDRLSLKPLAVTKGFPPAIMS